MVMVNQPARSRGPATGGDLRGKGDPCPRLLKLSLISSQSVIDKKSIKERGERERLEVEEANMEI